jgi:hypothetical protein
MSDATNQRILTYATTTIDPILIAARVNGEVVFEADVVSLKLDDHSDDVHENLRNALEERFRDVDDTPEGFDVMLSARALEEIRTGLPTQGFHVLDDTAWRATVIGHFDGKDWWMPGSERPFAQSDVMGPDGTNPGGRFNRRDFVPTDVGGAQWRAPYGRIA